MNEKCFCHFNGYEVKDAKARSEIENLKSDVDSDIESLKCDDFYDFECEHIRVHDTDCYITTVPKYDKDGNEIVFYADEEPISPLIYAQDHLTSLTINMGTTQPVGDAWVDAIVIIDGEIISSRNDFEFDDWWQYLCITNDNKFVSYQANQVTAEQLIENNVKIAFLVFNKLVENGVKVANLPTDMVAPRQVIGVKEDGTVIILSTDGRTSNNRGLTMDETGELILSYGCVNAWNLDGGGSTSTELKTIKVNRNIDENGTFDRKIHYTLNVKKEIKNENVSKIYSEISKQKQLLNKQIREDLNTQIIENNKKVMLINGTWQKLALEGYQIVKANIMSGRTNDTNIKYDSETGKITVDKECIITMMSMVDYKAFTDGDINFGLIVNEDTSDICGKTMTANKRDQLVFITTFRALPNMYYRFMLTGTGNDVNKMYMTLQEFGV